MYDTPTATISINYWLMPLTVNKKVTSEFVTAQDVINAGCRAFGISKFCLESKSRERDIVRYRDVIIYVIRLKVKVRDRKNKLKEISLTAIGKLFNRDHTTILTAIQRVDDDLSVMQYRQQMNEDLRRVMELI